MARIKARQVARYRAIESRSSLPKSSTKVEPVFFTPEIPEIPEYEILTEERTEEPARLSVKLNYDTGNPRPTESALKRLTSELSRGTNTRTKYFLPRGAYPERLWVLAVNVIETETTITWAHRPLDFEVYGWGRLGTSKAIRVFLYDLQDRLPTKTDLFKIGQSMSVENGIVVLFFLPTMNPDAPPFAFMRVGNPSHTIRIYPNRAPPSMFRDEPPLRTQ